MYAAYVSPSARRRRRAAAGRRAIVSDIGERHGFREHAMLGQILLLAASVIEGDPDACQALENVLGLWRMAGGGLAVPVLLTELAEGCLLRRRPRPGARRARRRGDDDGADAASAAASPRCIRIGALLDVAEAPTDVASRRWLRGASSRARRWIRLLAERATRLPELGDRADPEWRRLPTRSDGGASTCRRAAGELEAAVSAVVRSTV